MSMLICPKGHACATSSSCPPSTVDLVYPEPFSAPRIWSPLSSVYHKSPRNYGWNSTQTPQLLALGSPSPTDMNSSAFFPALFVASAACPSTSAATFSEGNIHSPGSSFRPDGLLAPQSSTWSHTAPLEWSYPDSETTSISDIERYRIL